MPKKVLVNLAPGVHPQRDAGEVYGATVNLVATRSKAAGAARDRRATFAVTAGRNNLVPRAHAAAFQNTGGVADTGTDDGQRSFANAVTLPHVGGNSYTVTARKKNQGIGSESTTIASPELLAWRRIYYRVHVPQQYAALAAGLEAELNALFTNAFIEFSQIQGAQLAAVNGTVGADPFSFGDEVQADALTHANFEVRIAIIARYLASESTKTTSRPASEVQVGVAGVRTLDVEHPAADQMILGRQDEILHTRSGLSGSVELVRAGQKAALTSAITRTDERHFRVTATAADWLAAAGRLGGDPTSVDLKYFARKQYTGMSVDGPLVFVTVDRTRERFGVAQVTTALLARVLAHEFCHALGGSKESAEGVTHRFFYPATKGGTAPAGMGHCGGPRAGVTRVVENRNAGEFRDPSRGDAADMTIPDTGTTQTCIMFHQGWSRMATATFCEDCVKQLRLFDLSQATLAWAGS